MAQLQGNDLSEWIKALEPVKPEDFKLMESGTLIIHESSTTLEPDSFEALKAADELTPELVMYSPAGVPAYYERSLAGWFYFPKPAPETPLLPEVKTKGRVKEFGGRWQRLGLKE